jgi:hypothetical protein
LVVVTFRDLQVVNRDAEQVRRMARWIAETGLKEHLRDGTLGDGAVFAARDEQVEEFFSRVDAAKVDPDSAAWNDVPPPKLGF